MKKTFKVDQGNGIIRRGKKSGRASTVGKREGKLMFPYPK